MSRSSRKTPTAAATPGSLVEDLEVDPAVATDMIAHSTSLKTPPNDDTNDDDDKTTTPSSAASKENHQKKKTARPSSIVSGLNKTYGQLIHEAIVALQDRTGSSQPAISKWILSHYPSLPDGAHFRRNLNNALKTAVQKENLTKIKSSYKVAAAFKAKERAKKRRVVAAAAKRKRDQQQQQQKKKKQLATAEQLQQTQKSNAKKLQDIMEQKKQVSAEELEQMKQEMARKEEAVRRRAAAEALAKELAERLRRRRFPMEDTKLHAEDKELGVKAPGDVLPRPYLPYFWHVPLPFGHKARSGKTSSAILQASKVDGLDSGSHGLVPDLLQVYHFFRGDVHFSGPNSEEYYPIMPDFTLQNLIFAVDQVLNGNARKSRSIPPLICHLFVSCLQILFLPPDQGTDTMDRHERKLRKDLHEQLGPALCPTSWAEVCCLYMDAMDRYYRTDASRDPAVLPSLAIDINYLLGVTDQMVVPMTPALPNKDVGGDNDASAILPDRYHGYLGNPSGALYRAQAKLFRQDPWMLTAEELMALLRALTDDILASKPQINEDIAARDEEMKELLRAKRSADAKFRKVRLAFEGPKKPKRTSAAAADGKTTTENGKHEKVDDKTDEATKNGKSAKVDEPFKPTATKKQFESATRAQLRANDAYEKGIRKLVSRTEPIGYDRNFNAVYCFRHDPEILYVEDLRPAAGTDSSIPLEMQFQRRSWHVIEQTSLFDTFASSLDIRGKRENELYEELLGPPGAKQSVRRFLHDDLKEQADVNAKIKEKEALKKRLKIARIKCNEEQGRRSGRLAGQAEIELSQIEDEINALEQEAKGEKKGPVERDFAELSGLEALRRFDKMGQMDKRRSREVKTNKARYIELMSCSDLCGTGNIDGTGINGMMVADMLEVEELCESLAPWEAKDTERNVWISNLENAITAWSSITPDLLGPPDTPRKASSAIDGEISGLGDSQRDSVSSMGSVSKRRRLDTPATPSSGFGAHSVSTIITMLKLPLLQLEERAADITNLAIASRDADIADDNMSTDGSDDDQAEKERLDHAWKRLLHRIRETPTKRYVQIRELLVSAINAARKAHVPGVVAQLRAALLLHHPGAAGDCKSASVKVLIENGGYDEEEDDEEEPDEEVKEETPEEDEAPSLLCLEAAILKSCLEGSDDASRSDWIGSVKSVKTISRLAALTCAFCRKAKEKLRKIEYERSALMCAIAAWEKQEDRKSKGRAGKPKASKNDFAGSSEVWANVTFTDEICMVKVEQYPWWPAKKCHAKDPAIASSLAGLQRSLVALVGEMGSLRVVNDDDIKPFLGTVIVDEEETAEVSKEMRSQLNDCVAIARRILRGNQRKK